MHLDVRVTWINFYSTKIKLEVYFDSVSFTMCYNPIMELLNKYILCFSTFLFDFNQSLDIFAVFPILTLVSERNNFYCRWALVKSPARGN